MTTPADSALAVVLAAAAAWETWQTGGPDPGLRAGLAALTALGVALRRRLPSGAAATVAFGMAAEAVLTESADEISVMVTILVVAYSVAAYQPRRLALVGLALMVLGVTVTIALDPSDSPSNIPPSVVLFVALPGAVGFAVHRGRRNVAALELETEKLAQEAEDAVEAERRRIARELHDVVSHAVTLIAVQAEAGSAVIRDDAEAARRALDSISAVSREALSELHRLLGLLHDDVRTDTSPDAGLERLPALVEGVRTAGLAVEVHEQGEARALTRDADRCAFRVLQEALTNALRHAPSSRVRVHLHYGDDEVRITVESAGRRHVSAYGGTGRGLAGLRERVVGLGGSFDAGPDGTESFHVRARLPAVPR